ncbi:putative mono [Apostichopus japonicus]|uniref:Poly [ADP-ribose] polymerase n=1 Tax=Stichopus japonicus TaxID=307972 RepID=A0A2G8JTM5_STIJA|nr:putative mono [Apostichopus japonicus]
MGEKSRAVISEIKDDLLAADLKWSLFLSALKSYRHDSILRPFPSGFTSETGEKDFEALTSVAEEIPSLKTLVHQTRAEEMLSDQAWDLLGWTLQDNPFIVKSLENSQFARILELTGQASYKVEPNLLFEVEYLNASNQKFSELQKQHDVIYAYHGSRLENFHSILHNGLIHALSKNTLFGEGTYLSSDLAVSMPYSPKAKAWQRSSVGESLSCVAVCQIIDHPDVKCQTENTDKRRARAPDSLGGDVPDKYYIVTNSELVRLKYLLIFSDKSSSTTSAVQQQSKLAVWVRNHKFALLMMTYILVLLFVGIINSKGFRSFQRQYLRLT